MDKLGKILVAVSGGVDSTAAAYKLISEGWEVEGAVMQLTEDTGAVESAKIACAKLGIPLHIFDFRKEFKENVQNYFVNSYLSGETPNPCVQCNKTIKFGAFLDKAKELGFGKIATGHYAKKAVDPETGRLVIKCATCLPKDQSYFLYRLSQEQIDSVLFPLDEIDDKNDIRDNLDQLGFENARKSDSQDICFVPNGKYAEFILEYTGENFKPGNFVNSAGEVIGKHEGIVYYTIGQRKGVKTAFGMPLYVKSKDPVTNDVVMAVNDELFSQELYAKQCNFMKYEKITEPITVTVKTRSVQKNVPCTVYPVENREDVVKVVFDLPQRAITPGQSAVFYRDDTVVGGGTISLSL